MCKFHAFIKCELCLFHIFVNFVNDYFVQNFFHDVELAKIKDKFFLKDLCQYIYYLILLYFLIYIKLI